ncbi:hypothetical protein NPIL_291111 [Nephila pilipes]|uniref:Uncharacterized protein n=1 Tax=Nephila pilipes TaxID=299642 RepID=A0A8X6P138_NEPPI|nr:hypothetical protein NPIL_291111 [Nephila pilipes]
MMRKIQEIIYLITQRLRIVRIIEDAENKTSIFEATERGHKKLNAAFELYRRIRESRLHVEYILRTREVHDNVQAQEAELNTLLLTAHSSLTDVWVQLDILNITIEGNPIINNTDELEAAALNFKKNLQTTIDQSSTFKIKPHASKKTPSTNQKSPANEESPSKALAGNKEPKYQKKNTAACQQMAPKLLQLARFQPPPLHYPLRRKTQFAHGRRTTVRLRPSDSRFMPYLSRTPYSASPRSDYSDT